MSTQISQDWENVVIRKRSTKPKSNEDAFRTAKATGETVEAVKKFNAGKNASNTKQPIISARKLETDEDVTIPKVSHNLALKIQQSRIAAGLTQKELATKINEKSSVINDYESGRAVPSSVILNKLERALGTRVRA